MASREEQAGCKVERICGGCTLIGVPYEEQLADKQERIRQLFDGMAPAQAFQPILGMKDPYHYRSKVVSPFAPGRDRKRGSSLVETGMYVRGTHRLVNTDGCMVENEVGNQVVRAIRQIMQRWKMEPYDEDAHAGFIRHAVVRIGHASNEVLVTIVTNGEDFPASKAFCRELVRRVPQITTIVQNINERQTNVILGERERTLYGPGFILDTLCGLSLRISSRSFYQVNAVQTEVLYAKAVELAGLDGSQVVMDAYCGTGTIGLVAASRSAARVIGVDSVEAAIRDARQNAAHNGIENAEFVADDATAFIRRAAANGQALDVLFLDPPRAGSTVEFLTSASALAPARIVYISCDPRTQARDAACLREHGYAIEVIQPVDMFPHTDHIENIVAFRRTPAA